MMTCFLISLVTMVTGYERLGHKYIWWPRLRDVGHGYPAWPVSGVFFHLYTLIWMFCMSVIYVYQTQINIISIVSLTFFFSLHDLLSLSSKNVPNLISLLISTNKPQPSFHIGMNLNIYIYSKVGGKICRTWCFG